MMYLLRIWFLLLVAGISSCSSIAIETTEYTPKEYDYVEVNPIICNVNQTREGCNEQRCAIGIKIDVNMCEGLWGLCKCKRDYWLNSTNFCVLRQDCDKNPLYLWL